MPCSRILPIKTMRDNTNYHAWDGSVGGFAHATKQVSIVRHRSEFRDAAFVDPVFTDKRSQGSQIAD